MTLPDGTTVRFDGYKQWATLQVSHDPTQLWLLIAAVLMVLGLLGSLAVRRRRLWVRLTPAHGGPDGPAGLGTLIEVGGLARNDSGNFAGEFEALVTRLRERLDQRPAAEESEPEPHRIGAGRD